ncbi:MAG: ABC transporter permease [Firmicutes bacterium]|jgi:peptide/nickel transport system permease protein|nr:ABC transporter permease [Bacillota bacterium]
MEEKTVQRSEFRRIVRRLLKNRRAVVGGIILLIIVFLAIFAPYVTPYDPIKQDIRNRLQGPSREHILGTDQFGRDTYTRIVYGARLSLRVGFSSILIAMIGGCLLGLVAGYYGGLLDNIIMRFVDILMALPGFLLALAIVAALGPGMENVIIAIGISYIPSFARLMRSSVLSIRELDYVSASQAIGSSDARTIFRHILPNSLNPIIVMATLSLAGAILSAAGLSFLGMGTQPPTPEWGSMISSARPYLRVSHWAVTVPGLAIFTTVLCLNLVGDGLRDALDPRMGDVN